MPPPSSPLALQPPSLHEATKKSTVAWQNDLEALFHHAKDRFPDVVWDLLPDENEGGQGEEVWGHKAIVYARAPPTFQARYFSFRPAPISSPGMYSPTGYPAQSALSLAADLPSGSRSPSPFRAASPVPSTSQGGILRLPTSINPTLFSKELEYLYTGKGFGEAFEFLFDSAEHREEGDAEENRIDKLRKDLVFMWRSRLYSDVRVTIEGSPSSNHEGTVAVFSTHRFILVSRSSYFHTALIAWGSSPKSGEPLNLTLPSPPFTPPALHFILGFIYTGTLIFSNRSYDLDTAFHIIRCATYLSLDTLYDEVQARIVQEMMHGLYHAFLDFAEYERVTGGKWGVGGCHCKQCARRVPRVLDFSLLDDVKNPHIERGARRALVGLFGEGWCNPDFARLEKKTRESILKGVAKRTTPLNIFPLLFAAQGALKRLESNIDVWADTVRDMIMEARKVMDQVLCMEAEECFEQPEWLELMEQDAARFDDGEKVEWTMDAVRRGFSDKCGGTLYQALVSSILLRAHATEPQETVLSSTSHIRVQVDQTRADLLRWLRRRWLGVRQEGGFDTLQPWALKEISDEIEVSVEDLVTPSSASPVRGSPTRTGLRPTLGKFDGDQDTASMQSLRTSVLNRNMAKQHVTSSHRDTVHSSASSIRSVARSTHSNASRASTVSVSMPRRVAPSLGPRPDSKLTPSTNSVSRATSPSVSTTTTATISEEAPGELSDPMPSASGQRTPVRSQRKVVESLDRPRSSAASVKSAAASFKSATPSVKSTAPSGRSTATSTTTSVKSPAPSARSSAASFSSVRSRASTIRKPSSSTAAPSVPSIRMPRPSSSVSHTTATASDGSTFKSARSDLMPDATLRTRKPSASSSVSAASARTSVASTKPPVRPRRASTASTTSTLSTAAKAKKSSPLDVPKRSPIATKASSITSVRSTASTSPTAAKKSAVRKTTSESLTKSTDSIKLKIPPIPKDLRAKKAKTPATVDAANRTEETVGSASPEATTKVAKDVKRRGSSDTITKSTIAAELPRLAPTTNDDSSSRGATLEIGIPCIISSKRARFRAFARYIGEVEGESGPWVGVEVPVGDSWSSDQLESRQWNDGTWGGIRYFDLGNGLEWDYSDERGARRRRLDPIGSMIFSKGLKREGDQLSIDRVKRFRAASPAVSDVTMAESRGLFVRPQQVLYVIDAVGDL
ncbi:hypothetical protein EW146_g3967 [Bondarzewia mesenterica]|uniref:BTB domain-containing protein n=1 Tax=Bondarzewia mesenterica TaxID=1095465 RepID=A0A4S4LVX8_9AGAM|nr:hypothetical protein EW146_g3967 [Bondarzewia mesenterica]